MPYPQPTKQGQGLNPCPHGYQSGLLTTEPRQELQLYFNFKKSKYKYMAIGVPAVVQKDWQHLYSTRMQVQIPGLAHWVKDLALSWVVVEFTDVAGSSIAVAVA